MDYFMQLDKFEVDKTNRSISEYYKASGKGVNVSAVLSNLGYTSYATGFLGGFITDEFNRLLSIYPCLKSCFTPIEGNSRINVKLIGSSKTEINAIGPKISESEFEQFRKGLEALEAGDIFVLSGNIQKELQEKMIEIVKELSERGVEFILDTNNDLIKRCIKYRPLLIKPNHAELEDLTGETIDIDEIGIILKKGQELVERGAKHIIISLGSRGSIYVDEKDAYHNLPLKKANTLAVGSGDSMVAGFIAGVMKGLSYKECYRYACTAASATTYTAVLSTNDDFQYYLNQIKVEAI